MNCLLTVLSVVSTLQVGDIEWTPIKVTTTQKMVAPQAEFNIVNEKMLTPRMKKTTTKTLVCDNNPLQGTTSSYLEVNHNK